jgi:2-polyprenyl-3-methyl-5-hydroxy-6-metoxy-1,4-benzoquinol methylase
MALETETLVAETNNLTEEIRAYWNEHIHDLAIAKHPVGTAGFFQDLSEYRFDKLRYLPRVVDFSAYSGQSVLEVGCGVGIDLVKFAEGGARVVGIDLAEKSIELARQYFSHAGLDGELHRMDGEATTFESDSFDMVYAHGVIQYAANAEGLVRELHRVLKPGGTAIMMVYNRISWLNFLSKLMKVELEHEDAPVLEKYSIREFKALLRPFSSVEIVPERFPVKTKLHTGLKAILYNGLFVNTFNALPRFMVRSLGWHIMAFAQK